MGMAPKGAGLKLPWAVLWAIRPTIRGGGGPPTGSLLLRFCPQLFVASKWCKMGPTQDLSREILYKIGTLRWPHFEK